VLKSNHEKQDVNLYLG